MTLESEIPVQLNAEIDDALHMARLGGADSAYAKLEQTLNRARAAGLRKEEARSLLALSDVVKWVETAENSFAASERLAREALALYTGIDDDIGIAKCNVALAPWSGTDGQRMLERALETFRAAGDLKEVAWVLERQATHLALRDRVEAARLRAEALALFEELGNLSGQATVLFGMAVSQLENRELSREYGLRALDLYRRAGSPKDVARMLMFLDDPELPAETRIPGLEEGIRCAADTGTDIWQASMMRSLAECYEALGRESEARELRQEADMIHPELEIDPEFERALEELAKTGDATVVTEYLKEMSIDVDDEEMRVLLGEAT